VTPLELTASGIVRALSGVDGAVRRRTEALASLIAQRGIDARIERRGDADYAVVATGENLFAREFGGVDRPPEGPVREAINDLKTSGIAG
jgi:hypothetical protein